VPKIRDGSPAENEQIKPGGAQRALPPHWWSVDPGQVHVGLAMWCGYELEHGEETSPLGLQDYVIDFNPTLIVIEAFTLLSPKWSHAKARQASDTLKLIGAVQGLARMYGGVVIEQQPSVRHVAQASPWWGSIIQGGSVPANGHVRSAIAHGLYYARFSKR